MFSDHLEGWEGGARGWGYGDIRICIADSLCYTAETNTTLKSNYTPIKMLHKKSFNIPYFVSLHNNNTNESQFLFSLKVNDLKSNIFMFFILIYCFFVLPVQILSLFVFLIFFSLLLTFKIHMYTHTHIYLFIFYKYCIFLVCHMY